MITGKLYNYLRFIALVLLPALGTLYFALAGIWGLPSAEEVVGTIVAVDTFLGVILHLSSTTYNSLTAQGTLAITETEGKKVFDLQLDGDPEYDLEGKDRVVFAVKQSGGKKKAPVKPPRKTVRKVPPRAPEPPNPPSP